MRRKTLLILLSLSLNSTYAQLDTAAMGDNTWVDKSPSGFLLPINGSNWAYENDFKSHPFFPFFVLGPGHKVHPQDCYYYPYDPLTNKWTAANPPTKQPRQCLSAFAVNAQDTMILQIGGYEGSHQLSQGGFASDYRSIISTGGRGVNMWAYSFNRNEWYQMKGPTSLPSGNATTLPQYDPVHDITLMTQGSDLYLYNFHTNATTRTGTPATFQQYYYVTAQDTRRGLFYVMGGGQNNMYYYDPETGAWSQVTGTTIPPTEPAVNGANGLGLNNMAYDELHDVMVYLSDDVNGAGAPNCRTWIFDCATRQWSDAQPATAPRDRGRLAYNKALNVFMMVGGTADTYTSRGGSTKGVWFYRYKRGGPTVFDGQATAPKASLNLTGGTVKLTWKSVNETGVTGYNIYRGTANPFAKGFAKLNGSPVTDTFYTDAAAVSGTRYSYRVCAVKGAVEGRLSRHLFTQPYRVLNVMASVEDSGLVRVSWDANPEPDLLGYNIYRATGSAIYTDPMTSGYTKLNSSPVNALEYMDNVNLRDGVARGYVAKAVNAFGLEGGVSPECTTFPNLVEWGWAIPQNVSGVGLRNALRWKPPRRTKVIGVNYYRYQTEKQNTAGIITDSVTFWNMPPATGNEGYELLFQTYYIRAVNVLGQEGFMTDQLSPTNTEFGTGIVNPSTRFDYGLYNKELLGTAAEDPEADVAAGTGELTVFPNPFNPSVNVGYYLAGVRKVRLQVFDMAGRMLKSSTAQRGPGRQVETFDLTEYPSGIYVIKVALDGRQYQKKAMLVK